MNPLLAILAFARRDADKNTPPWLRNLRRRPKSPGAGDVKPPRPRLSDLARNLESGNPDDREQESDPRKWLVKPLDPTRKPTKAKRNSDFQRRRGIPNPLWRDQWDRAPRMSDDDKPPPVGGKGR